MQNELRRITMVPPQTRLHGDRNNTDGYGFMLESLWYNTSVTYTNSSDSWTLCGVYSPAYEEHCIYSTLLLAHQVKTHRKIRQHSTELTYRLIGY